MNEPETRKHDPVLDWLKAMVPPEWGEWPWVARLTYVVIFVGGMAAVIAVARWLVY